MSDDDVFSKPKTVRGPHGRFVSKKTPPVAPVEFKTAEPEEMQPIEATEQSIPSTTYEFFDDLSYYGERIRRSYSRNQWFFVIEDMLPLAQITDPMSILASFRESESYKESLDSDIYVVDVPKNNAGISSLTLANQQAVLEFVRFLRDRKHFFPGRFPEWIASTSEIDFAEAQLARMQKLSNESN